MTFTSDGIFRVENVQQEAERITATLSLNKGHSIFRGHFPGQPVVPGACLLALVKDVIEDILHVNVQLKTAGNIKFTQMITPENAGALQLTIAYKQPDTGIISLNASILNGDAACFKLQAVFRQV